MRPDQVERDLRARLDALGPARRAELLHVLMLPDFNRADRIGEFWSDPQSRAFAELLIDCEEDQALRAVLVGMLRESLDTGIPTNRRQSRRVQWRRRLWGDPTPTSAGRPRARA